MMISIPDDNKPVFQHHSEIIGLYKIFVIQRKVMVPPCILYSYFKLSCIPLGTVGYCFSQQCWDPCVHYISLFALFLKL